MNTDTPWPTKADLTDLRIKAERVLGKRVNSSKHMQPNAHVKILSDGELEYGCSGWVQPYGNLITATGLTPDECLANLTAKALMDDPLAKLREQAALLNCTIVPAP